MLPYCHLYDYNEYLTNCKTSISTNKLYRFSYIIYVYCYSGREYNIYNNYTITANIKIYQRAKNTASIVSRYKKHKQIVYYQTHVCSQMCVSSTCILTPASLRGKKYYWGIYNDSNVIFAI